MNSFHVSLQYSAWWLIAIFIVSGSMAWLLYSGKNSWNKRMRIFLGSLRFISFFLVLLLLLNPQITSVWSYKEKPVFPIVVDNSQSIPMAMKNDKAIKETITAVQKKLQDIGFESVIYTHAKQTPSVDSFSFDHQSSNIATLLSKTEKSLSSKKTENILLFSDGIYNSGISPSYLPYHAKISVLGLGDTVPRKDLVLKSVQNNSVAFMGNKFPLRAEIQTTGFQNTEIELLLKGSKGIIERQKLKVKSDFWFEKIDFAIPATEKGFQRFTIEIVPKEGESNLLNNKMSTYVDVVDDRENVLIISEAPHPNIKAIRSALSNAKNIQIELLILGINEPKNQVYDLIILHNCLISSVSESKKYIKENSSILYIAGSETDFGRFNTENGILEVISRNESDEVLAAPNTAFSKFKLNEKSDFVFGTLPPVAVPFGELKPKSGTEIALFQKINAIQSTKPLLVFGQGKRKTGVLLTDGIWQWRMYEAQETGKSEMVDELIIKTVQYLSSKEDKRKFRIYPHQREYYEGETPRIETELYNDLYEKVYGQKTVFQLSSKESKTKTFEFSPSEGNSALVLPALPAGVYKISAKTNYSGKELSSTSEFIIKERQLEALDLRANHELLRELCQKNDGTFFPWQDREKLLKLLDKLETKIIWKKEEKTRDLIEEKWFYFLIFLLIGTEWTIRRYSGGY